MSAPINEEQAAKTSRTAVQLMSSLQQRVDDLVREVASLKTVNAPAAETPKRKTLLRIGTVLFFFAAVVAAGAAGYYLPRLHSAIGPPPRPTLILTGSNTLGDELVPHLAVSFLQAKHAVSIETIKTTVPGRFEVRGRLPGDSVLTTIEVNANGSENAFRDLAESKCDIGMSSRRITAPEVGRLSRLGNMTSAECEHVIGLDGVAIIVNKSRASIKSLTMAQAEGLLTCRLPNWSMVGLPPSPVKLFRRNDESGTYKTLRDLLLGGKEICGDADVVVDSEELSARVALDRNALGFIGLPYVHDNRAVALSDGGSPPLAPSPITVGTEEYPLTRRLYLYTPDPTTNGWVKQFVEFVTSPRGQAQVMRDGFVGQNIMALPVDKAAEDAPSRYRELTAGIERLSLDFRFESGSADLDNKAVSDLARIADFFRDPARAGRRIMLFGFADSTGGRSTNCRLAQTRADSVASRLRALKVPVGQVLGFCDDMPIASNSTPEGRNRIRRVEAWVK
jgi:phosphate transport system substrate-binding protein